jgi:N utilization substance protein B
MQALYAYELGGGSAEEISQSVVVGEFPDDTAARAFSEKLFALTIEHAAEMDEIIREHTQNWEVSRIALIDRLLLRMAICEILHFEDIPPKVSINEAIEVAKKFSTANSGKFVNGILDATLITLHQQGRLKKTGRGLVGIESIVDRAAS